MSFSDNSRFRRVFSSAKETERNAKPKVERRPITGGNFFSGVQSTAKVSLSGDKLGRSFGLWCKVFCFCLLSRRSLSLANCNPNM
ncbi:hypothetical protein Dimus_013022 [Dionaea muscipula]